MEKIANVIGRIIFGKAYNDGFVNIENKDKDLYVLTSVFPNKKVMNEAYSVLQDLEKNT